MRVVHLSTSDLGGAAMAAINLHRALLDSGVESDLLTMRKTRTDVPRHTHVQPFELGGSVTWNKLKYKFGRVLETTGLTEDRNNQPNNNYLKDRPAGYEIFTLPYSWFSILEHPLVQQADVVHLHWVSFGMVDYADFFANCKSKVVWTMHDMNAFTGGCHHADDCTGFTAQCSDCPQLKDRTKAHGYWRYKADALHGTEVSLQLVAPSQWLAGRCEASTIMRGRSVSVIPNGIDVQRFRYVENAREQLALPKGKRIVMFNALDTANPRKGVQYLVPALQQLKDPNVLLVSVGGRSAELPSGIEVQEAGFVSDPEVLAMYYSAADLFVLPSLAENLPNTISESLLCGTPVVAFRVGGIPEQVGVSDGILVDAKSSEALTAGIAAALQLQWDPLSIAERARARYDSRVIAQAYQRIYGA
jgi:glycosyltransferase involved in cell wall biosynthesis